MMLTCATILIYAHRVRKAQLVISDASKSLRVVRRVHRGSRSARKFPAVVLCAGVLSTVSIGFGEDVDRMPPSTLDPSAEFAGESVTTYPELRAAMSYKIVMSQHAGADRLDRDIQAAQRLIARAPEPCPFLEQLGWLYVAKARASHDPGFYKLAEHCALALEVAHPKSPEALLLRGHVLVSFHRFAEAEAVANELAKQRTMAFDYGLLGDALMEQGRLTEAIAAYQRMVDLRPDMQSYSRVAHMRWLKGDLDGAIEVAQLAARAASTLDPESGSWSLTRLGLYCFLFGSLAEAKAACNLALRYSPDYPAALLLQGRMLLAGDKAAQAVAPIQCAAERNPLPEFQWALADTLRAADRADEAAKVEAVLKRTGAQNDPRTLSLFLATRGEQVEGAVELARREFRNRADILTHDALAWALAAAGRHDEAWPHMEKALAEGTVDARLFTHAGVLASKLGRTTEAESWLTKARGVQRTLLPSELQQLAAAQAALARPGDARAIKPTGTEATSAREN
jgi:tetratricopeptide (TPR) repeat protein